MGYEEELDRALETVPGREETIVRFSLPDPIVRQEGNVTVYENFQRTLDALGREDDGVMKYLQKELGTSASIDERGRLRLTGSFRARRVHEAMDAYVDTYVRCPECELPDTRLETRNGETALRCDACGARAIVED